MPGRGHKLAVIEIQNDVRRRVGAVREPPLLREAPLLFETPLLSDGAAINVHWGKFGTSYQGALSQN